VALKLLRSDLIEDPKSLKDFQREAKAIATLQHPNIVTIYDFGISQNKEPYLVMEYVAGHDLGSVVEKEKPLSVSRLIGICLQICAGLTAAHSKNIIHCDLKPSNILISGSEPNETVKLVDFGLAQIVSRETTPQTKMTPNLITCGTPLYMSPEQSLGQSMDERCDMYSLGCLMFECFTGINPFRGETVQETFERQVQMVPPLMDSVYAAGKFPPELVALVDQMLAKEPAARPQSMEEVGKRLLLVLEQVEVTGKQRH
jgi:serine/threonine-protein kinase